MTIKQILAQLGGVFPMDEAVIESESWLLLEAPVQL
jgi:hypothetical protein